MLHLQAESRPGYNGNFTPTMSLPIIRFLPEAGRLPDIPIVMTDPADDFDFFTAPDYVPEAWVREYQESETHTVESNDGNATDVARGTAQVNDSEYQCFQGTLLDPGVVDLGRAILRDYVAPNGQRHTLHAILRPPGGEYMSITSTPIEGVEGGLLYLLNQFDPHANTAVSLMPLGADRAYRMVNSVVDVSRSFEPGFDPATVAAYTNVLTTIAGSPQDSQVRIVRSDGKPVELLTTGAEFGELLARLPEVLTPDGEPADPGFKENAHQTAWMPDDKQVKMMAEHAALPPTVSRPPLPYAPKRNQATARPRLSVRKRFASFIKKCRNYFEGAPSSSSEVAALA